MEIQVKNAPVMEYDAIVIPFSNEKTLTAPVPSEVKEPVEAALAAGKLGCTCGLTYALNLYMEGRFVKAVLVQLGDGSAPTGRYSWPWLRHSRAARRQRRLLP